MVSSQGRGQFRLEEAYSDPKEWVAALSRELGEWREQQAATSEILRIISSSPNDAQRVFDAIARSAAGLCKARFCQAFRFDGALVHFAAHHGLSPEAVEDISRAYPMPPSRASAVARAILSGLVEQIPDVRADPEYMRGHFASLMRFRSVAAVPMLKDGVPIGAIAIARSETGHFAERQIELLKTFADQAVIAIQNARLFEELQARTREVTDALEQQTATAEILRVISTSPADVQPVFEAIVRNAVSLCCSLLANVFRFDGELLHYVTSHNVGPSNVALLQTKYPMRPDSSQVAGRVILTKSVSWLEDAFADPDYDQRFSVGLGFRRMLGVPMLRKGTPVGVIVVGWVEPGPASKAQEELLKSFADQAVIAIENARLFEEVQARTRELGESLQQQTATADVLKVISRSPFELQTILDTLVESAARLCEADTAGIARQIGSSHQLIAHYGMTPGAVDYVKNLRFSLERGSLIGRVLLAGQTVQIPDALADQEYAYLEAQKKVGFRTMLGVPLLREGNSIGVIILQRGTVQPFTDKQVELVKTFADQAVIAIENARLFDEVQEKTRQLELANTFKSRFLAAASHDLRQPLHALNLFIAQLRTETDPAERTRLVVHVGAAVGSMNDLFDALLDMSKLDAGLLEPHLTEFPIERLLERLKTTFADAAREKGLRLRMVPSRAWVCSDFILLERIALNLVSNAVRYTARGGVVIGWRRRGNRLRLDVCDSGVGIPEDEQPHIFGEFYQLGARQPDRRSGLGLGLSIVDRLGQLLEHPIEVVSHPGKGSRFSVSVPLVATRRAIVDAAEPPATFAERARGKLIVVIDDDALVLDGMRGVLRSWGCRVVTAASDSAALALLTNDHGPPDLIISDYRLADGKTGIEAIERLREALGATIPAFLISGDTAPERLREASASGYHLLHKPVPPMALRTTLNRVLKTARVAAGTA